MNEYFAALTISNTTELCIGGITRSEAAEAKAAGLPVDATGFYLFLASPNEPSQPIEILAKFFSAEQAELLMAKLSGR